MVPPADDVRLAAEREDHDDHEVRADLRNVGKKPVISESSVEASLFVVESSASAPDAIAGSAMDAMNGASKSSQNLLRLVWVLDDMAFFGSRVTQKLGLLWYFSLEVRLVESNVCLSMGSPVDGFQETRSARGVICIARFGGSLSG